jgi:hypothetical protein
VFRACTKGGSTSPKAMVNESPKAQISGGKAAFFANALRTTRSTSAVATGRSGAKIHVSILLQISSEKFSTRQPFAITDSASEAIEIRES